MNRISKAFENGKAFIGFLTAGDPTLDKTEEFILTMEKSGVDLIEIGIPFSDPVAEGKVIQRANIRALSEGTTIDKIFEMVKSVREKSQVPLVFLTYLNPVFIYGYEAFFSKCKDIGIDGIIIPDLPFEEKEEIMLFCEKFHVNLISLIAPTSEQRISIIAREAKGFVYCVSSLGVTGVRSDIKTDLQSMISAVKKATKTPIAVGFGISTTEQASVISEYADGIIVGSAIVKIIEQCRENAGEHLERYITEIKTAIK